MTLYLDTSALVKLYVAEDGSALVRSWAASASVVVTARVTHAEARAALAQGRRLGGLTSSDLRRAAAELDADWPGLVRIDIDETLVARAGGLAEEHALRGYDAVQLAAALEARGDGDYLFASFDGTLNAAAAREGLPLASAAERTQEGPAVPYGRRARANKLRVAASGRSR